MPSQRLRSVLIIAIAAAALGIATTAMLAAAGPFARKGPLPSCAVPALPGAVVDITLTDMGRMMRPRARRSHVPVAPGEAYSGMGMGMMRALVSPATVPAGPVSLRVRNTGGLVHEVVVLPLPQGQFPGQRVSGPDGKVDESGSLGEASHSCGADQGDGIAPGAAGWTTITLPPARYELICNIAGHYRAGMYTELDVTGQTR